MNSQAALSWRLLTTLILDVLLSLKKAYLQLDLLLLLSEKQVFIRGHLNTVVQCAGPATDCTPCGFINACQRSCSATMKLKKRRRKKHSSEMNVSCIKYSKRPTSRVALHIQMLKNTQPACVCTSTRGGGSVCLRICVCVCGLCCIMHDKTAASLKKNPNPAAEG